MSVNFVSSFPASTRDIAFSIDETITFDNTIANIRGFSVDYGPTYDADGTNPSADNITVQLIRDNVAINPGELSGIGVTVYGSSFQIRLSGTYNRLFNQDLIEFVDAGGFIDREADPPILPKTATTVADIPEGSELISALQDERNSITAHYKIRFTLYTTSNTTQNITKEFTHDVQTNTSAFAVAIKKLTSLRIDPDELKFNANTLTGGEGPKLLGSENDADIEEIKQEKEFVENSDAKFSTNWDIATASNVTSWAQVESTQGTFDFSGADQLLDFTNRNKLRLTWHGLVSSLPTWFTGLDESASRVAIDTWIRAVANRYANDIENVNVVSNISSSHNDTITSTLANQLGRGKTGIDWLIFILERVRLYLPFSKITIDDYDVFTNTEIRKNLIQTVNELANRNLIDACGIQANYFEVDDISAQTIKEVLYEVDNAITVPIHITKFDLSGDDEVQLNRYDRVFTTMWTSPYVERIHLWGYILNETYKHNDETFSVEGSSVIKSGQFLNDISRNFITANIENHGFRTGDRIQLTNTIYSNLLGQFFTVERIDNDNFHIAYENYPNGENFAANGYSDKYAYARAANIPSSPKVICQQFNSNDLNPNTGVYTWSISAGSGVVFDNNTIWGAIATSQYGTSVQPVTWDTSGDTDAWRWLQIYSSPTNAAVIDGSANQPFDMEYPWNTLLQGPYGINSYWDFNITIYGNSGYPVIRNHGVSDGPSSAITVKKILYNVPAGKEEVITGLIDREGDYIRPAYQYVKSLVTTGTAPELSSITITDFLLSENAADILVTEDGESIISEPSSLREGDATYTERYRSDFSTTSNTAYPEGLINNNSNTTMSWRLRDRLDYSPAPWVNIPSQYTKIFSYNLKSGVTSSGPQIALRTNNAQYGNTPNTWQTSDSAVVDFTYFVPRGHPLVGKYFHIGATNNADAEDAPNILDYKDLYSPYGVQIIGGEWTTARLLAGEIYGGRNLNGTGRFLCIADQPVFSPTMDRPRHTGVVNADDITNPAALEQMIYIAEYVIYDRND